MSKKTITKYFIASNYNAEVSEYDDAEDKAKHSDNIEDLIKIAEEDVSEWGRAKYIVEIKKIIKPVQQPYNTETIDYE